MAYPYGYSSYPPISPVPKASIARPQSTSPAFLTLCLLAPNIPEMLTDSTPPLRFIIHTNYRTKVTRVMDNFCNWYNS
jgi:hypothetical protein